MNEEKMITEWINPKERFRSYHVSYNLINGGVWLEIEKVRIERETKKECVILTNDKNKKSLCYV